MQHGNICRTVRIMEFPIRAGVVNTEEYPGPYVYNVEVSGGCGDVSLHYAGNRGTNVLTFQSFNPQVEIEACVDDLSCDDLGTITVTIGNGDCEAISSRTIENPCSGGFVQIRTNPISNDRQVLMAVPNGMSSISSYAWRVIGAANILSGQGTAALTIDRSRGDAIQVALEVTDSNGCASESTISLPMVEITADMLPVLQNATLSRRCDQPARYEYRLLQYGTDDEYIDYTTIEVLDPPADGAISIDTVEGVVVYIPNAGAAGIDTFSVRVRDNNGNFSNTASVTVQNDCMEVEPGGAVDVATVDCNGTVDIAVLNNDDNVIPESLVISQQGVRGTATVLANGLIRYVANENESGSDTFFYEITSPEGATQRVPVEIVIGMCCDDYFARLVFDCEVEDGRVRVTATPQGEVAGAAEDFIENSQTGSGASILVDNLINSNRLLTNLTDVVYTVTRLGVNNGARITIETMGATQLQINRLVEFLNVDCEGGVVQFGEIDSIFPRTFLQSFMTMASVNSSNEIVFNYNYHLVTADMVGNIKEQDVRETVNQIGNIALENEQGSVVFELDDLSTGTRLPVTCYLNDGEEIIDFTRTIRRNGCPDIVLLYRINVAGLMCGTAFLISGDEGFPPDSKGNFRASFAGDVVEISNLFVNGSNILNRTYSSAEITNLTNFLNNYAASQGGGSAQIFISAGLYYLQFVDVTFTPETLDTQVGELNFVPQ